MKDRPQDLDTRDAVFLARSKADLAKLYAARKHLTEVAVTGLENEVLDLHGYDREDALCAFIEQERRILDGLRTGEIAPNKGKFHYFKLICGFGNHSVNSDELKKNRYFFEQYLSKQKYNFTYWPEHGVFLIRYNAKP
jgi:hypothetical protein